MPRMQEAVTSMNAAFAAERLGLVEADAFAADAGLTLAEALQRSGVELQRETARFVDSWPSALQAAVRAVLHDNLVREGTVPVTFAWAPGYDYEVTVWDVRDTTETAGGITILFRSRYPSDPHPLTGDTESSSA